MTGLHDLALFAFTVLVLNATPGVDMVYAVTQTLKGGARAGLAASAGICAGCVVHTLLAAFGLAAVLAVTSQAFQWLSWLGAAYLAWIGVGQLRGAAQAATATASSTSTSTSTASVSASTAAPQAADVPTDRADAALPAPGSVVNMVAIFRQGLLTNVLNPKVALFILALLPQFIDADAPHKTLAFLTLGAWLVLQGAVFMAVLVGAATLLRRRWGARPASPFLARGLNALGGLIFFGLAWRLATSEVPALPAVR